MDDLRPSPPSESSQNRSRGTGRLPLDERPLITTELALRLARTFKVLANDTRLRLLHELARAEERSVTELADAVGLRPQAVSNQLQRLIDQGVVEHRRDGSFVYYRLADPCIAALLDLGLCIAEEGEVADAVRERGVVSR